MSARHHFDDNQNRSNAQTSNERWTRKDENVCNWQEFSFKQNLDYTKAKNTIEDDQNACRNESDNYRAQWHFSLSREKDRQKDKTTEKASTDFIDSLSDEKSNILTSNNIRFYSEVSKWKRGRESDSSIRTKYILSSDDVKCDERRFEVKVKA